MPVVHELRNTNCVAYLISCDDQRNVPSTKHATQEKRISVSAITAYEEARFGNFDEAQIRDEGVIWANPDFEGKPVQFDMVKLAATPKLRMRVFEYFKKKLERVNIPKGKFIILCHDCYQGPLFYPPYHADFNPFICPLPNTAEKDPVKQWYHHHGEADTCMFYFRNYFVSQGIPVIIKSIDTDVMALFIGGCEPSTTAARTYWITEEGKRDDDCYYYDLDVMQSHWVNRLKMTQKCILIAMIMCGTDHMKKSKTTRMIGVAEIFVNVFRCGAVLEAAFQPGERYDEEKDLPAFDCLVRSIWAGDVNIKKREYKVILEGLSHTTAARPYLDPVHSLPSWTSIRLKNPKAPDQAAITETAKILHTNLNYWLQPRLYPLGNPTPHPNYERFKVAYARYRQYQDQLANGWMVK